MASIPLIAGMELGGTKCVALLSNSPGHIVDERRTLTTAPKGMMDGIIAVLTDWKQSFDLAAIDVARFGTLDLNWCSSGFGQIVSATKPGWIGADLLAPLSQFGVPVALDIMAGPMGAIAVACPP